MENKRTQLDKKAIEAILSNPEAFEGKLFNIEGSAFKHEDEELYRDFRRDDDKMEFKGISFAKGRPKFIFVNLSLVDRFIKSGKKQQRPVSGLVRYFIILENIKDDGTMKCSQSGSHDDIRFDRKIYLIEQDEKSKK